MVDRNKRGADHDGDVERGPAGGESDDQQKRADAVGDHGQDEAPMWAYVERVGKVLPYGVEIYDLFQAVFVEEH